VKYCERSFLLRHYETIDNHLLLRMGHRTPINRTDHHHQLSLSGGWRHAPLCLRQPARSHQSSFYPSRGQSALGFERPATHPILEPNHEKPANGMASGYFPSASLLFNPPNSSSEVYWQVSDDKVNELGYFGQDQLGLGLQLNFIHWSALEHSWAPINFFDIHQSAANVLLRSPLGPHQQSY
jgi:hypothetical protein